MNIGPDFADASYHFQQICGGRDLDADIDRLLAVKSNFGLVVLSPERDIGDVLQTHHRAVGLLDDEIAEFICRVQAGRGRKVDLHHLAFGGADT